MLTLKNYMMSVQMKTTNTRYKMEYTTISIDRKTAERLRTLCYKTGKTRADLIREWVKNEERELSA